jgi:hypothetical protein
MSMTRLIVRPEYSGIDDYGGIAILKSHISAVTEQQRSGLKAQSRSVLEQYAGIWSYAYAGVIEKRDFSVWMRHVLQPAEHSGNTGGELWKV